MFTVNPENYTIDMHRGDTGVLQITLTGYTFTSNDRILLTIRNQNGAIVKEGVYTVNSSNTFSVSFLNSETDFLDPGTYIWDIRCIVNPVYDSNGNIIDGDKVATPRDPMSLTLRTTVGQI